MGKVSIVKVSENVKESLLKSLNLIGKINCFINKNDKVMIKPNLNGLECTNINLTEALIQILFDNGNINIVLAESTFGNKLTTNKFFIDTGYLELAKKYGIHIINLNESKPIHIKVDNSLALKEIKIAKEVIKFDKIINVPVMKVHYATGVTLAMKNLKGLLVGEEKRHFHEIGLDKAIVDLNSIIKTHLNIIDCIACMEKMGPRGGNIVNLNAIIAGENIAEVDYIGLQIMNYSLDEVKHLKYFIEKNNINLNNIEIAGESIKSVAHPFVKVNMENIIHDNIKIHNVNACSSCVNALLLSLIVMGKKPHADIDFFLGSIINNKGSIKKMKIAFGNCCKGNVNFDLSIKGCPPYPFDLKEKLQQKL